MKKLYDNEGARNHFKKLETHLSYENRTKFFAEVVRRFQEKQVFDGDLPTYLVTREDIDAIFDKHFYALKA